MLPPINGRSGFPLGTGELVLPGRMQFGDLKWEWIPRGMPWWKPGEELDAELRACMAGADRIDRVSRAHGFGDPRDNIDANMEVLRHAQKAGFPISWVKNGQPIKLTPRSDDPRSEDHTDA